MKWMKWMKWMNEWMNEWIGKNILYMKGSESGLFCHFLFQELLSGQGVPEGCILSVRCGSTRRQAPFETAAGHPLKFPTALGSVRKLPLQVGAGVDGCRLVLKTFWNCRVVHDIVQNVAWLQIFNILPEPRWELVIKKGSLSLSLCRRAGRTAEGWCATTLGFGTFGAPPTGGSLQCGVWLWWWHAAWSKIYQGEWWHGMFDRRSYDVAL